MIIYYFNIKIYGYCVSIIWKQSWYNITCLLCFNDVFIVVVKKFYIIHCAFVSTVLLNVGTLISNKYEQFWISDTNKIQDVLIVAILDVNQKSMFY